ncbi:MAG: hypothetical protein O7E54_04570, partial [Planctomycetota bacterium]|nr:hypothetical protein [Planctomycetota bacterium]
MRCALLFPLLLVCTPAVAQASRYDALLDEAVRLQNARRPGEPVEKPYERAYQKLFEAYKADPRRYEAPMQRGLNRCDLTVQVRALLVRKLNTLRVGGGTPAASTVMEKKGVHLMDMLIQQARQDFSVMASRLRAARIKNPELLQFATASMQFATASMKYAQGDYLGK